MKQFLEIEGLAGLEQAGKWRESIDLLERLWQEHQTDSRYTLRLMAQCWYVLLNLDVAIDAKQIDDDRVRALLIQVTKYAIAHMREDYDILYLGGYMITLMAQVYCEDDSDEAYEKWVTTGLAMLERAFFMKPEDARAATFYYGALPDDMAAYEQHLNELSKLAPELFAGDSAVEAYFLDILKPSVDISSMSVDQIIKLDAAQKRAEEKKNRPLS